MDSKIMETEHAYNRNNKVLLSSVKTNRCKYYNRGYCKLRENCKFLHPKEDCTLREKCQYNCLKRHRIMCRYGIYCYHNKVKCVYLCIVNFLILTIQTLIQTIYEKMN